MFLIAASLDTHKYARMRTPRPGELLYRVAMEGKWRTTKQIAAALGYCIQAVDASVRRYEREGLIARRKTKRIVAGKNVLQWRFVK